ncbi:MAG: hypothetical protein LBC18_00610 [Opitutaceae bacterium]|nr:hypothetical protein [Opitutaceae bacterium]
MKKFIFEQKETKETKAPKATKVKTKKIPHGNLMGRSQRDSGLREGAAAAGLRGTGRDACHAIPCRAT